MTPRLSHFLRLIPVALLPAIAQSAHAKDDNVVIDDEIRVFTIKEKDGKIASVKSECKTFYVATEKDGYADAIVSYNDNITIDKASAPDSKPYYRSWNSPDVFYDGAKICYLHVPLKKGKKVPVSFNQTYRLPEHFCDVTLPSNAYMKRHATTVVKVPARLADRIKVTPFKFTDNIRLTSEKAPDGSVTYTVKATDLQPWRHEPSSPSPSVSAPQIIITGHFADTGELYRYLRSYCDDNEPDSPELDAVAAQIKANADTPQALADSTAAWVRHNIRYLAIEHGEYAFRPTPAAEVLSHRAGDCKGSANLIKALLRKNGLDGRLVWIGTAGKTAFDWDDVPALSSGNHVIAACQMPDSIIYLDGTTTWASPGYIPPSIRGRRVIVEDGDNHILSNVPDTGLEDDREEITAHYIIDGNDLTGETEVRLSGVNKMSYLSALASREPRDRQKLTNRILAYPKSSTEVSDAITDCDLSLQTVTITGKVRDVNGAQRISDKIYVDLQPIRDALFTLADTTGRSRDYKLPFGYRARYDISVRIPEGYTIKTLPEPMLIDNDWHKASMKYTAENDTLRCVVEIATGDTTTPQPLIATRNEAVRAMRRQADMKLVLTKTGDD